MALELLSRDEITNIDIKFQDMRIISDYNIVCLTRRQTDGHTHFTDTV